MHSFEMLTRKPHIDSQHVSLITPVAEFSTDSEIMKIMCPLVLFGCRPQSFDGVRTHPPCSFPREIVLVSGRWDIPERMRRRLRGTALRLRSRRS